MIRYIKVLIIIVLINSCSSDMTKSEIEIDQISNLIGEYSSSDSLSAYNPDSVSRCDLKLVIEKVNQSYLYHFESNSRSKSGILSFKMDSTLQLKFISLENFEWDDYTGPLNEEGNPILENPEIPQSISGSIEGEELFFQNYGNWMNYYVKISECGAKYFRFRKIKKISTTKAKNQRPNFCYFSFPKAKAALIFS